MIYLYLLSGLLIHFVVVGQGIDQPVVAIRQGILKGLYKRTINNRQIASFEGIPYAVPPIGERRFEKPIAADVWHGVLNATRAPPICLQYDFFTNTPILLGSEDCLYINVYTPKLPTDKKQSKLLDVIAFIHGGAFAIGTSVSYTSLVLLDRDLVLVTFNYRLGSLGFLSTEDEVVPGNNGLKDQVIALKWIQENIAAFGGNPSSVTIGGLSAGGISCHFHLLSPVSKGLFKGAVCMSGISINPIGTLTKPNEKTKLLANELGCPINDSLQMIKCLKTRPAEHIVGLTQNFLFWHYHPMVIFGPVVEPVTEDAFISQQPIEMIKNKIGADVPTLISFAADEGLVAVTDIITNITKFNELLNRWDELIPVMLGYDSTALPSDILEINKKIKEFYHIDNSTEGGKSLVQMFGDCLFLSGISRLVKVHSALYSSPMYVYKFSYRGKHSLTELMNVPENLGVCHGDDVYYTVRDYKVFKQFDDPVDLLMSETMLDIWVSFAANGTLDENWQPTFQQLPKVAFTDIKGPFDLQLNIVEELGEERFWESLGLEENIESSRDTHVEL